jgi:hypothetical protein
MGWRNSNELPDDLKDLGMTSAEIKKAIQDKKDLEKKVADQSTELNTVKTSLSTMEGSFGDTKRKLDELEASSHREPVKQQQEKTYTSFIDDENKAFTERAIDAMQPVAQAALKAGANSAKLGAKMSLQGQYVTTPGGKISLARLWEKWSEEIDKAASEVGLATLGNESTWINIFDYVKGKHFNELMSEPQTFVESVQTNQDRDTHEGEKRPEKLNDEENNIIKKMSRYGKGVTPEAYQKTKDKLTIVGV